MNRTLPWVALLLSLTFSSACGGSDSPASEPSAGGADPVAAPRDAPPQDAAEPPPERAEPPPPAGDAGAAPGSCSIALRMVDGRAEYDERCASSARQCTLEREDDAWSCLCTAASGSTAACRAERPRADVITPPPSCCPAE